MVPMVFAIAVVLLLCVTSSKLLYRYGVPTLLIFFAARHVVWVRRPGRHLF